MSLTKTNWDLNPPKYHPSNNYDDSVVSIMNPATFQVDLHWLGSFLFGMLKKSKTCCSTLACKKIKFKLCFFSLKEKNVKKPDGIFTGWRSTANQLLVCSLFNTENGPLLIFSSFQLRSYLFLHISCFQYPPLTPPKALTGRNEGPILEINKLPKRSCWNHNSKFRHSFHPPSAFLPPKTHERDPILLMVEKSG